MLRIREQKVLGSFVALLLVTGCDHWFLPVEVVDPPCVAETRFLVGAGSQPSLSWAGGCRIRGAAIEALATDTSTYGAWVWEVHRDGRGFASPVTLGAASDESTIGAPHFELQPGARHRVVVLKVAPSGHALTVLSTLDVAPR